MVILYCVSILEKIDAQLSIALTQKVFIINAKNWFVLYYDKLWWSFNNISVLYDKASLKNTLGEVISKGDYINKNCWNREIPTRNYFFRQWKSFKNETRILVPSPKVPTYDLKPEMSAKELTKECIKEVNQNKADFICLNLLTPTWLDTLEILKR